MLRCLSTTLIAAIQFIGLTVMLGLCPASIMAAAPPYPPSSVVTEVTWSDRSTIVRKAVGGDTWPITWADDGNLYTAYGDGNGFLPNVPNKLSLGFARVSGPGDNPSGVNIRSATGEQFGNGPSGKKASGMLMVDGVLYMWVRNADGNGNKCQLAWSSDHAVTWLWSTWTIDELGYCTFLNFGQNYAGARDGFVYTYSHDNPSAYTEADHMVLLRVPKDELTDRSKYEWFARFSAPNQPLWSSDANSRAPVFEHPGNCRRSGISYNAPLKRYLWWQQIPTGDTRRQGGFGIYEAPEPWGPWSTVYFNEDWDVGPGETGSFPTKWMSGDGRTLHLVFSGDDSFSVRQVIFGSGTGGDPAPNSPTDLTAD